jgi:hypothetical protein
MTPRKLATLLALGLVPTLAAACGDIEAAPADPADTWSQLLQLYCEDAHRCRDDGESAYDPLLHGATVGECLEMWHRRVGTPAELAASVEGGRIDFDAASVDPCLSAREGLECTAYWHDAASEDPTCGLFAGVVPVGGECTVNADCAGEWPECFNGACYERGEGR